jgi:cbb3-type cytochrome c oxidase subunit III
MKLIAPLLVAVIAATSFSAFASTANPESASAAVPTPAPAAKPDLAKGEAIFGTQCASCHGADGNSGTPAYPKLAQQHPEYLVKQLQEYKSGKRANAIMSGFASTLSEQDMKNIAFWVTSKKAKLGFAKEKELVTLGERIYRGGIADRQVPACAGCHAPNGAGIPAQYPRLSGQHAEYSAAQLIAFRDGVRKNNLQMSQVAAKMNDREIRAVADYIAGLR